ncbi:hypothetical protein IVB12_15865 [Bradyrhizobium sp. 179]|uniref:hypothetical protein n=1 Tax=Bradyrhizobium sp. 179 TaxID=2782648 RepID=UPI001FF7F574|nr:hypothetical protein [Bradyrhizobium sp. 179]MCK1543393.1 hypothetical protein [Bradyrhizobium sp. 179]
MKRVTIHRHEESYEVRVSYFFYFDHDASRRAVSGRDTPEQALEKAKALARAERDKPQG